MKKVKKVFKSKIFWLIFVIVVVVGIIVVNATRPAPAPEYVTESAHIGKLTQTVSATGQVKSASEIDLNFKTPGQLSVLNVDTGDEAKAGDILAQTKANDLQIDVSRALADVQEAQANLDRVIAGATTQDIAVSQAAVTKAQTDLTAAESDLVSTETTYRQALENAKQTLLTSINIALGKADIAVREINDIFNYEGNDANFNTSNVSLENIVLSQKDIAGEKIIVARADYDQAKSGSSDNAIDRVADSGLDALLATETALDSMSQLLGYVVLTPVLTQVELDTIQASINTQYSTVDTNLSSVQSNTQVLVDARITYQTKTAAAQNAVTAAEKNLAKAQADLELKKSPSRPEDIALYQARLRRAQASLSLAQDKYDETILRAPIDGVVTAVNFSIGEQTSAATPVIELLAKENFEIEVDIPESDIAKVSVGDQASITLDAFSDEDVFSGLVITINPAQTEIQDVIYYKLTVSFATNQPAMVEGLINQIKPGMTANVDVLAAEKNDVLIIPYRAVKERDGKRIVEVLDGATPKEITVTTGLRGDDGLVEIIDGLSPDQRVITFTRTN